MRSASTGEHGTCVSAVCPLLVEHRLDLLHCELGCEGFGLLVQQVSTTKTRAGIVINVPHVLNVCHLLYLGVILLAMVIFDLNYYYEQRYEARQYFKSEHPDGDFEASQHPVELSSNQEEQMYFRVRDTLHRRKVLQQGESILRFRPHIPRLFRKFLDEELGIASQKDLNLAIVAMTTEMDDFLNDIFSEPITKQDGDDDDCDVVNFQHYIVEMYSRFLLNDSKFQNTFTQQRLYLLLKDKGDEEIGIPFQNLKQRGF